MQIGDRIKFQFGGEEKEGVVEKVFAKKIYLKVDFPGHPAKRLIRPLAVLEGKVAAPVKKKKKAKAEKIREKKVQQKKEEAQEDKE